MKKIKVAVLFGGCSSEYDVSLQSASALLKNINRQRYEVYPIGISQEGDWFFYAGDTDFIATDTWRQRGCQPVLFSLDRTQPGFRLLHNQIEEVLSIDVVFPMLHGTYGEDGRVQGLLELAGIPYVGCGMMSSAMCMDKYFSHQWVASQGIDCAKGIVIDTDDAYLDRLDEMEDLGYPLFVKPVNGGSSIGISKVNNRKELMEGIRNAFCFDSRVLVEEMIEGDEIGCAIIQTHDQILIGGADHLHVSGDFFDYQGKYVQSNCEVTMLADENQALNQKAKDTALAIYKLLQCNSLARVDMFVTADQRILFNEINTLPGFTANSRFPRMMKAIGISYPQIIDICLQGALHHDYE